MDILGNLRKLLGIGGQPQQAQRPQQVTGAVNPVQQIQGGGTVYSPGEGPQTTFNQMPQVRPTQQYRDPLEEAIQALYRSPVLGAQPTSRGIYSPGEGPRTRF